MFTQKLNNQVVILPSNTNYKNSVKSSYNGNWYPTAHPLKIWRKSGMKQHIPISQKNTCIKCQPFHLLYGKEFKELGKNSEGINKLNAVTNETNCILCDPTKGPKGTNSAGAKIRSATTNISKDYFTSSQEYLKRRCKSVTQQSIIHKNPTIAYFNEKGQAKWPSSDPSTSAGSYLTNCCDENCNITYKPSNPQYATQGGVDNATRLLRLKYNTINTTNNSYKKRFLVNYSYITSHNSIYFIKSKMNKCTKSCYTSRIRRLA